MTRPFEEFDAGTKDKKLAEMRYQHYLERLIHTLNKVLMERHRISMNDQNVTPIILEEEIKAKKLAHSHNPARRTAAVSPIHRISKKTIQNEKTAFREHLQREAQTKLMEESHRRKLSHEIKEKLENASKREKEYKASLHESKTKKAMSVAQKAKELESSRSKLQEELKKRQNEDIGQKEMKRQMLMKEKVVKYQQQDEELNKKIEEIKRHRSIADQEDDRRRIEFLEELEANC